MDQLTELAIKHNTDKFGGTQRHIYTPIYHNYFNYLRDKAITLLEIGVGGYQYTTSGGASLRMWKEYFPQAMIYSMDIYDKSALEEERIKIFKADQGKPEDLEDVISQIGKAPDIIIDDGSHVGSDIITSFETLFPYLNAGSLYIVEDTQTSYWSSHKGDESKDFNNTKTAMGYFKALVDGLNYQEFIYGDKKTVEVSPLAKMVFSICFYHNLIFIQKQTNGKPVA